jgi:hypothetical protein
METTAETPLDRLGCVSSPVFVAAGSGNTYIELFVPCMGSTAVPPSLFGLSEFAVAESLVGSATVWLRVCVSFGFGEVVAGADVWDGNPESTVDLGVAAGVVVAECNVGTAIASAGCNALGANAVDQQCHLEYHSDTHALTIE